MSAKIIKIMGSRHLEWRRCHDHAAGVAENVRPGY